jgi:hypothetical protein
MITHLYRDYTATVKEEIQGQAVYHHHDSGMEYGKIVAMSHVPTPS